MKFFNWFFSFFLISISSFTYSQDVKIYLLSRKIGPVIDSEERIKYNLIPKMGADYKEGFFLMYKERFYLYISFNNGTDSTIAYQFASYQNSAKRVQLIEKGKKNAEDFKPEIEFIDTVLSIPSLNFSTAEEPSIISIRKDSSNQYIDRSKTLPLTPSDVNINSVLKSAVSVYIGAGTGIRSDLNDLNKLYNAYERTLPFVNPVGLSSSDYSPGLLFNLSVSMIIRDFLFTELKISFTPGGNINDNLNYKSMQFSLGYRYKFSEIVYPYISAGYARNYFYYNRSYNMELENSGTLLSIEANGISDGLDVTGGVMIEAAGSLIFNFYVGYKFMSNEEVNSYNPYGYTSPEASINTGGPEAGFMITFR